MESLYSTASAIVERAQPNLDGGLPAFALDNFIHLPGTYPNQSSQLLQNKVAEHVLSTFARTGYAVSVACGIIWMVILFVGAMLLCRKRRQRKTRQERLIYVVEPNHTGTDYVTRFMHVNSTAHCRKLLHRKREQIQSYWLCSAIQFFCFVVLVLVLGSGVLLGFTTSSQLHANLAAAPSYEQAVGRLLNPAEMEHTDPPRTYVFPRLLRALGQLRAYLSEFVYHTKNNTEPVVISLINATEAMQDRMTVEFNTLLFNKIGVEKAFQLGDELGSSAIFIIKHYVAIEKQDAMFKDHFDQFKIELRTWLRLIQSNSPATDDSTCDHNCSQLRALFVSNLTARPDTFMPDFRFAIALKFMLESQNQTADTILEQLNHGRALADKQLSETKKIMAERINIPDSIRNMTNNQWDSLSNLIAQPIEAIDEIAVTIVRNVTPRVSSWSFVVLAIACILWSLLFLLTIGAVWLVIYHHCVPSVLHSRDRQRVRTVAGCGLILFGISMCLSILLFLAGGYLRTEVCRYLDPNQRTITVVEHDVNNDKYTKQNIFPLDSHINSFIDRNWKSIKAMMTVANVPGEKPMPIPRIRSPIYAITEPCRENKGIMEALDAIRSIDMSSLNDPEMSERFINIGREIMIDSLRAIDVDEMFPKETEEQLASAGKLDDFRVDFEKFRSQLPTTFLSVQSPDDETGTYIPFPGDSMWSAWDVYFSEVLEPRMSSEQISKLQNATVQLQSRMLNMTLTLRDIDSHLVELTQAKKVAHVVKELQDVVTKLKTLMSDKESLINMANKLFNETIAKNTPKEAEQLIAKFGPRLMAEVGRCRRLYEVSQDINSALCVGVIGVLNGLWFVLGWVVLVGCVLTGFGLMFLLHKPVVNTDTTQPPWKVNLLNRREVKQNGAPRLVSFANHTELENLSTPEHLSGCERSQTTEDGDAS